MPLRTFLRWWKDSVTAAHIFSITTDSQIECNADQSVIFLPHVPNYFGEGFWRKLWEQELNAVMPIGSQTVSPEFFACLHLFCVGLSEDAMVVIQDARRSETGERGGGGVPR